MTIIFQMGGNFWIEFVQGTVTTITDDINANSPAITLERPGVCIGYLGAAATRPNQVGRGQLRDSGGSQIQFEEFLTTVLFKGAVSSGSPLTMDCIGFVFLRKRGPR